MRYLIENQTMDIWGSWFAWTLHRNTGAAFGLASHSPVGLLIFASVLTLLLAGWWIRILAQPAASAEAMALALILGGSAGNLTDRFWHGAVIDFIDFKVWPIFNFADIAITAGASLWALCVFRNRQKTDS